MSYEIKTPVILESVDAARAAIAGILDGTREVKEANALCTGARTLQSAVSTDVKARLAKHKIAAYEAKHIEAQRVDARRLAG